MNNFYLTLGLLASTLVSLEATGANIVTEFPENGGNFVGPLTNSRGVNNLRDVLTEFELNNPDSETTSNTFIVPGTSANTSVTFTFVEDLGGMNFNFGFFPVSNVSGINPITDQENWAQSALNSATVIFDDNVENPGSTAQFDLPAGQEIAFFLIPNNTLTNFNLNSGAFYPSQTVNSNLRSPLFSISDANPGQLDQLVSFIGQGTTLFSWEDLTRTEMTDNSFTDLVFTIDAELNSVDDFNQEPIPINNPDDLEIDPTENIVPEPTTIMTSGLVGFFLTLTKRKKI